MSTPANVSRIAFQIPGSGVEFRVLGFTHREALSSPFCCDLDLACERADLHIEHYLGCAAVVSLHHDDGVRLFHGCVVEMSQGQLGKRFHAYGAVLRPLFWQLSMRSGLRIFQNQTVPDIVETLLNDAGLQQKDVRFDISATYPQRPYCCQYNETDLDFISRLLEQEGLFYYFEHRHDGHCLVISDKRHSFGPIPGASSVSYRKRAGMVAHQESLYEFHSQQQLRAGAFSSRDYFFEKPSLTLSAQASQGPWTGLEQHRYPGHFHQTQQGQHRVNTALGAEQQDQHSFEGKSDCPRLAAGKRVRFTELPQGLTDGGYLLTHLKITATQPQAIEAEASSEGSSFAMAFSAMPADQAYYPKQTTPRPRVAGIQTAVVTGPKGEEIYTDAHGRVKVQFHWDREGNNDQHSSCWLRVSQAWAGNQWGAFVLPRIGQEVIVRHLNGDPDQPIITGALYNQKNQPPDTLPQHKTRTLFKSQTSPRDDGYNEIYLDDQKGQEQIFIHGQRDIDVYVKNDLTKTVKSDHHQIVNQDHLQEIGADQNISVGQNHNTHIGGDLNQTIGQNYTQTSGLDHRLQAGVDLHLKSNTDITLDAGEAITLKGGGGSIVLDSMGVAINGIQVRINSGGSARPAKTTTPATPQEPESVAPGKAGYPLNERAAQNQFKQTPVEFDQAKFEAVNNRTAEVPTAPSDPRSDLDSSLTRKQNGTSDPAGTVYRPDNMAALLAGHYGGQMSRNNGKRAAAAQLKAMGVTEHDTVVDVTGLTREQKIDTVFNETGYFISEQTAQGLVDKVDSGQTTLIITREVNEGTQKAVAFVNDQPSVKVYRDTMETLITQPEMMGYVDPATTVAGLSEGEQLASNVLKVNNDRMPAALEDAAIQDFVVDGALLVGSALPGVGMLRGVKKVPDNNGVKNFASSVDNEAGLAGSLIRQVEPGKYSAQINQALKSNDPGILLEGQVGNALDQKGLLLDYQSKIRAGFTSNGKPIGIGEIDAETPNYIIEIASGAKPGKIDQLNKLQNNTLLNPNRKPVVLFAPKVNKPQQIKAYEKIGVQVINDYDQLFKLNL